MAVHVKDKTGTNAGWRIVREPGIRKCDCGGFISRARAAAGATVCSRCETGR